ncbi:solute carrier family 35 member C2 isoform X2 [Pipistrellus kuhlii]|uniref:solute carrier family 35 member C2 isoform X2 n=1 Tax=Pipistrellus kuhlii TaxID=59472 RepID=UPI00174F3FED|nr:solute carrier family 35 member C2 isoform X2 [Pipistrellus kuhlii]
MGRWALDVAFVWRAVLTLGLVLLYYCFSIGITFYNKWLTKSFHFPLFMTMLHLAVIFLFSALSRALVQCSSHRARVVLSWTDYLRRVAPTALATALDVGLSNWSFLYITVSLYTMTKSSAVLFILIFSLIFKLEELRAALVLVVLLIAGGLFMFTYKSTQFNMEGFALVLGASFIGGIRWTLTQILLQKADLGLHLSTSEKIFRFQDTGLLLRVLGSLFLGGILAFGLGFSEFLLVSRTSSLTLSIAGIFKVMATLSPRRGWAPTQTWSCCCGAASQRKGRTRRRRRTWWPRDSSNRPGEQLGSRPLPAFILTAAQGPGGLSQQLGAVGPQCPGCASGSTGPVKSWSNGSTRQNRPHAVPESQPRSGGLCSAACQAPAAKIMISEVSRLSQGPGPGLQSSWGEMESWGLLTQTALSSESRSIYSSEIKGLQSTGHFMLPGRVGAGRGSRPGSCFLCLGPRR